MGALRCTRVFLPPGGASRARRAVDWIVDRQAHARILVPATVLPSPHLPRRIAHPPFSAADPAVQEHVEQLLGIFREPGHPPACAIEAVALALLEEAPLIAGDVEFFRDLIPMSAWSMNVPGRPTDGLLVQHVGITSKLPSTFRRESAAAVEALLAGERRRVESLVRSRRRGAREDGPARFRRVGRRSAGLRPFVIYLDLLPLAATAGPTFASWLKRIAPATARRLLNLAGAVFI